jgi:hypothetical protein
VTVLRAVRSATPIADEYRFVSQAMMRCERKVFSFDAAAYAPAAVERARAMWLGRMEAEHRSASVFAALLGQLMAAGATIDMEGIVLRMAQDELRHAEVCAEAVTALGGEAVRDVESPVAAIATHGRASAEECALRNVVYGCCLSETINAARFVDALDTMRDPFLRDVTRQLLSDEALHAQFGYHYLTAWSPWLDEHPEVRTTLARYLQYAFAVLERDLSGRSVPDEALSADEIALGIPDPRRSREVFYATVEGAILPSLERFGVAARSAWDGRSFEPP